MCLPFFVLIKSRVLCVLLSAMKKHDHSRNRNDNYAKDLQLLRWYLREAKMLFVRMQT